MLAGTVTTHTSNLMKLSLTLSLTLPLRSLLPCALRRFTGSSNKWWSYWRGSSRSARYNGIFHSGYSQWLMLDILQKLCLSDPLDHIHQRRCVATILQWALSHIHQRWCLDGSIDLISSQTKLNTSNGKALGTNSSKKGSWYRKWGSSNHNP